MRKFRATIRRWTYHLSYGWFDLLPENEIPRKRTVVCVDWLQECVGPAEAIHGIGKNSMGSIRWTSGWTLRNALLFSALEVIIYWRSIQKKTECFSIHRNQSNFKGIRGVYQYSCRIALIFEKAVYEGQLIMRWILVKSQTRGFWAALIFYIKWFWKKIGFLDKEIFPLRF